MTKRYTGEGVPWGVAYREGITGGTPRGDL